VEGKKPRKVNFEKWRRSDSSSLIAADGAIPQWTEDIPTYSWDSDGDEKKKLDYGNHTKKTQHGPSQSPPKFRVGQENGKKSKKRIRWSQEELKEVLWCLTYIKEKTLGENNKEAYKLWRERNPMTRMNIDAKALLNQKNYTLKTKRITAVEIDEIKNIRLKIGDDTEDYTNGVNGDKIDRNVIELQKRDQESNNTGFGKVENNKHQSAEG
jgi:hypothetical protein